MTDYSDLMKRIVELEKREKHLEEMFHGWRDEARKAFARIAELETENKSLWKALKPFAAVEERDLELWYGLDPDPFVPDDAEIMPMNNSPKVGDLRFARKIVEFDPNRYVRALFTMDVT